MSGAVREDIVLERGVRTLVGLGGRCWEKGLASMGTARRLLREHIRFRQRRMLGGGVGGEAGKGRGCWAAGLS